MRFFLSLLFAMGLLAQTTVYLRSSGPAGTLIVSPGCTNTTPMVCTLNSTAGLNPGDIVSVAGVCASDGLNNISAANGIRKIGAVVGSTISLQDLNGNSIAGNGAWCDGSNAAYNITAGTQYVGKLTPFQLVAGARGWFDGANGPLMRKLSLGTQNGLAASGGLAVSGNVATVTTTYNHGVNAGDHVTVWNTASAALNNAGNDYTVLANPAPTATTFSFATSGVSNGDYTTNAACGPGSSPNGTVQGMDNCVRISQLAVSTNPYWTKMKTYAAGWLSGNSYRYWADGGTSGSGFADAERYAQFALLFLVDQANQPYLTALLYGLNRVERLGGVNFMANETVANGGNRDSGGDFASYIFLNMAAAYSSGGPYLTAAQKTTFLNKMFNDLGDSAPCAKSYPLQTILAAGTAQAADATSITLAATEAHATGYYVNNVVIATTGASQTIGLVTAYTSATRIATVASWSNGVPYAGSRYMIYATISRNGTAITGYNTAFTSTVSAGDMVYGENAWATMTPENSGSYVTAVNSDTSLTVINGPFVTASGAPTVLWLGKQWQVGDCGLKRLQKYWPGYWSSQPASYAPQGGYMTGNGIYGAYYGGNNHYTWAQGHMLFDLVTADDDPRAISDLAQVQTAFFDYLLRVSLNYTTGFSQSGDNYQWDRTTYDGPAGIWAISHSVIGYPSMDTTGPMMSGLSLLKMFATMPDTPYIAGTGGHTQFMAHWGDSTGAGWLFPNNGQSVDYWALDHGMAFNPTAASSQYLKNFIGARSLNSYVDSMALAETAVKIDPRVPSADYTVQPHQYLFTATSQATCAALTGWPCPATFRADAWISRTGWSSPADTFLFYQARNFFGDHDVPQPGQIQLYKAGFLLATDSVYPGQAQDNIGANLDFSKCGSTIEFSGANTFNRGEYYNEISTGGTVRWASANHGAWATAYGDQNSNYVYSLADLTGDYRTRYNRVQRHLAHLKKPGTEEVIIQFDDVDASNSPTAIRSQLHYPQNGETTAASYQVIYNEGTTTCPGPNGCAGLNIDRLVLEQEDGSSTNGDPARQYDLISKYFSPAGAANVFVRWDGSAYAGGNGHANRVSFCADPASTGACGATASRLEMILVHKVATQPDTTLTASALNPDANWTGVQTADKVVLFARNGSTPVNVTTFTTTHSGTAQYLIAGLAPGTYSVTVGSATVVPFATVSAGDNTLYFESTAGSVSITRANPPAGGPAVAAGVSLSAGVSGH